MNFKLVFEGRDFTRIAQPAVGLQVLQLRWTAFGGAENAQVLASGSTHSLWQLADWLGFPLTMYDALGEPLWWGFLHGVRYDLPGGEMEISLEQMTNRVAVAYTGLAPLDQSAESSQTDWAEDSRSQARFGVKECLLQRRLVDASYAEQLRDLWLQQRAYPRFQLIPEGGARGKKMRVVLECRGWMHTLSWKGYQTSAGMIAHAPAQNGSVMLGEDSDNARVGQSFVPDADMLLSAVDLRLRREGSPSDTLTLSVQTDNSSRPSGTLLGSASVSGGSLEDEGYPWVRFSFDPGVSLSERVRYWLVLARSGSSSHTHYYLLGADGSLGYADGVCRVYNQAVSAWMRVFPPCDLLFRAFGVQETTEQLAQIYTAGNQFMSGLEQRVASGVFTPPYKLAAGTCLEAFMELLRLGSANHRLLLAEVSPERKLIIREQPAARSEDIWLDDARRMFDAHGNLLLPWAAPVGRWVRLKTAGSLPGVDGCGLPATGCASFIRAASWDAASQRISLEG